MGALKQQTLAITLNVILLTAKCSTCYSRIISCRNKFICHGMVIAMGWLLKFKIIQLKCVLNFNIYDFLYLKTTCTSLF